MIQSRAAVTVNRRRRHDTVLWCWEIRPRVKQVKHKQLSVVIRFIKFYSSSARQPIHDLRIHAHLRCITRRWVRGEDRQHSAGRRRVWNDFHRPPGQRDECKSNHRVMVLRWINFPIFVMQQVENSLSTYEPHACIIVYSIIQKSSFRCAEEILNYLWRENVTKDKAVIVVGNKADLARSRAIATSGKVCFATISKSVLTRLCFPLLRGQAISSESRR